MSNLHNTAKPSVVQPLSSLRAAATVYTDLSTASVQWLICNECICDLELDVADGLVAQRPLTGAPLETLQAGSTP